MINIENIKQILLEEKISSFLKNNSILKLNSRVYDYLFSRHLINEKNFESLKIYLCKKYPFIREYINYFNTSKEMFYCINNNYLEPPKCNYCSNYRTFNNAGYYNETCGNKNCIAKAREDYNLIHYGARFPLQNEEIKRKTIETNKRNHGGLYNSQTQEYKEKFKQTSIKKYGVDHPNKSQIVKDKIEQTNREKYGCNNYTQTEEYRVKTKQTCQEKYGVDWPGQAEITKENIAKTNLEKYGVKNYAQTEEYKEKAGKQTLKDMDILTPVRVLL